MRIDHPRWTSMTWTREIIVATLLLLLSDLLKTIGLILAYVISCWTYTCYATILDWALIGPISLIFWIEDI